MTDEIDPRTEDRLTRALRARDAEVTPTTTSAAAMNVSSRPSPWRRAPLAVAAIAVLLAGVVGTVVVFGDDDDDPDVATESPTTTVTTTTTTEPPEVTTTTPPPTIPPPAETPEWLAQEGLVVWPRDSRSFDSMESAAVTYATEVLGVVDPALTYDCCDDRTATAELQARGEGGRDLERAAAIMTLVETDGTWDIVQVDSPTMHIDRVDRSSFRAHSQVRVSGEGSGFEGTGLLTVTSWCDPTSTTSTVVSVGSGPTLIPFSAPVDVPACDTVIVQLSDDPAADGATPSVASVAAPGPSPSDIVVMRVGPDDVLNVRAEPDAEAAVVTTLSPFATGISRTGATSDEWWEITAPDGATGWANSRFLSVQFTIDDEVETELETYAAGLAEFLDEDLPVTPPTTTPPPPIPPFSPLGVDIGGIGVYADAPTPWVRVEPADIDPASTTTHDWSPFPGEEPVCDPSECELTVADFLGFEDGDRWSAEYTAGTVRYEEPGDRFFVGLPDDYTERFATVLIEIPATNDGDLDWRTYVAVFDFRNTDPEIIAIWRWGWTP